MENTEQLGFMTNSEVVEYAGLPESIINDLATQQGTTWQATANQFLQALVNKIVYQKVDKFGWENPFKKYDSFPVNYGDTIENIFVPSAKGHRFNKDATDPFTKTKHDVKTLYATINYEMQYPATIEDALLRRAALNEYGFMNIINSILESLTTGKNLDEYFATIRCLNNPEIFGNSTGDVGSKEFETLDLTDLQTDAEKASAVAHKIVDDYTSFTLPNTNRNALKVMNASKKSDILLIIKKDLLNAINLDYLTGVFNLEKVDIVKNILEVEDFRVEYVDEETEEVKVAGEDLGYMIIDTRGFDNHVCLQDGGLIYNPKGKYTNHFLNLWKIISFKYYMNARAYKVQWEEVTEVVEEETTDTPVGGDTPVPTPQD